MPPWAVGELGRGWGCSDPQGWQGEHGEGALGRLSSAWQGVLQPGDTSALPAQLLCPGSAGTAPNTLKIWSGEGSLGLGLLRVGKGSFRRFLLTFVGCRDLPELQAFPS